MGKYTREQLKRDVKFLEENGIHLNKWVDVSDEFYHNKSPGISASGLKTIRLSTPSKYIDGKRNPSEKKSDALILGSAIHKYILEPEEFDSEFLIMTEESARKNDRHWKAFVRDNDPDGKKIILKKKDLDMLEGIKESLKREKFGQDGLNTYDGVIFNSLSSREQALFTVDERRGIIIKIKVDVNLGDLMLDLKSTTSCEVLSFMKNAVNYGYGIQAATYIKTATLAGVPSKRFGFIAVEKESPYDHSVIVLKDEDINLELQMLEKTLDEYAYYLYNDIWPGAAGIDMKTGKEPLVIQGEFPNWYRYQLEEANGFEGK